MAAQLRRSSRQVERKRKLGLTSEEEAEDLKPAAAAVERGAGPLPPLTDLMLTYPLLLRTHVVPLLTPIDLVGASHVSKEHRRFFSSDEAWRVWAERVFDGNWQREVEGFRALPFLQQTMMHAYIAATTHRCHVCGEWSQMVHALKNKCTCWKCFQATADTEVMVKSKAVQQYLLTSAEASRLPCLTIGDTSQPFGSMHLVLRPHAEQLATQRYPDGMAGLLRDKAERRAAAEARHAKKMQAYHAKRADAQRQGLPLPKYPKSSPLLSGAIDVKDGGACARSDDFRQYLLMGVGYLRRADPTKALTDELQAGQVLVCKHCKEAKQVPIYKTQTFPSSAAVTDHLLEDCPYYEDNYCGCCDGAGCGCCGDAYDY